MRFRIKLVNAANEVVALSLEAQTEALARDTAARQGCSVLSVSPAILRGRVSAARNRFSVLLFSMEMLALLEAGLNLVEALQTLAEKASNEESRQVPAQLLESLNEGQPFSRALEMLPGHFNALYIATVRASERTGDLKDSLSRYIAYQEEFDRVRRKVVSASLYPAILLFVGIAAFLFLMLYVVPRFAHVYQDIHTELPFFSALLLNVGSAIEGNVSLLLVSMAVLAAIAVYSGIDLAFRAWLNDKLWQVPALGERLKLYQLARLYRTMGMLLRAGIPVVRAIDMVSGLLATHLRQALMAASQALQEGKSISAAFSAIGLTTPVATRMLLVGERTGCMGEAMERIARFYDDETARSIDTFTKTFEPMLMAALGLMVGMMVVLMYMPIFELAGSIQ